jgi:transformation/transcription domain-associated protein
MVQTRVLALLISTFHIFMERVLFLDMLFNLITIYAQRVAMDLKIDKVPACPRDSPPLETKHDISKRFLTLFDEPTPPIARITQFLCIIINPMIIATYSTSSDAIDRSEKLITTEIADIIHRKMRSIMAKNGFPAKESSGALTIEPIHMTRLMIQHCPDLIHETRKDVMKSAWASVSSEDSVVKQTSNLLIARFFKAFDSPSKLILRVWAPPIPERGTSPNSTGRRHSWRQPCRFVGRRRQPPSWVKVTKRFLLEEAGAQPYQSIELSSDTRICSSRMLTNSLHT